ncbi:FG-GAP repeat domain-containing protein [Lentzea sp. JNUCC 0626]|uniref:FG-GAP repeat domain-containing protein n=1 Tax=Lentzea sp. JNUCC 0626 TaxID=3367513 RepID=UPI0037482E5A
MRFSAKRLVFGVATAALVAGLTTVTAGPAFAECPEQRPRTRDLNVTKKVYEVGKRLAVSPKVMLAGFEAGWVESKMNNLPCGHADSLGVFQQQHTQGWGTPEQIMNVDYAATRFFEKAKVVEQRNPNTTAGIVAADTQLPREDLRWKYDAAEATAQELLREVERTSGRSDRIGDVSGDRYADLLGLKPDGTLHYYANNINSSPKRWPFGNGTLVGQGFGAFKLLRSGDVSGDGYADLIGVRPDGTLVYFPNNINSGNGPYGAGIDIGTGFQEFSDIVLGDFSGDGYADLIGMQANGTLVYFPNNMNSNPGRKPYLDRIDDIGQGFTVFSKLRAGDVSGDGYADLIGVKPDGTLHYFPNNINSRPCCKPFDYSIGIGEGFNVFSEVVAGDLTGDGYADLFGVKPDGTLHHFPNNINSNANGKPYTSSDYIGEGFGMFSRVV